MKKKVILVGSILVWCNIQASQEHQLSKAVALLTLNQQSSCQSERQLRIQDELMYPACVIAREQQVDALLETPTGKSLLFAIENGCDNYLIASLMDNLFKKTSDNIVVSIIVKRAEQLFREKSPHVLALKARINSGATRSDERTRLKKNLFVLLKTGRLPD